MSIIKQSCLPLLFVFALAACAAPNKDNPSGTSAAGVTLNGAGASSQEKAQVNAWIPSFAKINPSTKINYTPIGSGSGRENFANAKSDFAGTDKPFSTKDLADKKFTLCKDNSPIVQLPVYISPIVVAFNLPGIDSLKLDAKTVAQIFATKITKWNDPAIVALNPDLTLPNQDITPIHRGDKSGTTATFLTYLKDASDGAWTHGAHEIFPKELKGESADKTSGMAAAIKSAPGTIGYLDASAATGLSSVQIKAGDRFIKASAESAGQLLDTAKLLDSQNKTNLAFKINYKDISNAYPIALVSYLVSCSQYKHPAKGQAVKEYFSYIISQQGQKDAEAAASNAPISSSIRAQAQAAVDTIK